MNIREVFKRNLPERRHIHNHRYLRFLGQRLHDPGLWHLHRRSAAGAVSVGLFVAFVPAPVHTIMAAWMAILFRVNLPISVLFVWVSNPVTVAPQAVLAYRTGAWLLNLPPSAFEFEFSAAWLKSILGHGWQPFLLGCLVLGLISAVIGNLAIRGLWRLHLVRKWKARRLKRHGITH